MKNFKKIIELLYKGYYFIRPKGFKIPCYNLEDIERKYSEIVSKKIKVK